MIPRAEIVMIIMERGRQLRDWAVSPQIFTSVIITSAITCATSPLILRPLFRKSYSQNVFTLVFANQQIVSVISIP